MRKMNQDCRITYVRRKSRKIVAPHDRKIQNDIKQVEKISRVPLFSSTELMGIDVLRRGEDFIEVDCGCTNSKYGDSAGKLRVYGYGKLEIACDCYLGCNGETLSPSEFEKHAGRSGYNWKSRVWVFVNEDKVALKDTNLLKYYRGSASDPSEGVQPLRTRGFHRDELMKCTACGKLRRFTRRNKVECKAYHLATKAIRTWTCSDHPNKTLSCEDAEEREATINIRGCPKKSRCKGCIVCICCGCNGCRFEDCTCRTCVDFIKHSEPLQLENE